MNKVLQTEFGPIEYVLQRKKMKNMRLKIENGRVLVTCSKAVQNKNIEEFILNHVKWIMETQKKIIQKKNGVLPLEYVNGETFHYLGEEYTLHIETASAQKAILSEKTLFLSVNKDDKEEKRKLFFKWMAQEAKSIFEERYASLYLHFAREIVPKPTLMLRRMKSRWGSANIKKKLITLNTALIFAPVQCIDYVIVHELSHFIHANHSKDFYGVVALHMPDWKQRRSYLNKQYSLDL